MRKRVYISGPISNGGRAKIEDRLANVAKAAAVCAQLIDLSFAPLCPQLTHFVEELTKRTFEHYVWIESDIPWVECADVILRIPGCSIGSDMEVQHAQEIGIPVVYSIEQLEEWRAREMQVDA